MARQWVFPAARAARGAHLAVKVLELALVAQSVFTNAQQCSNKFVDLQCNCLQVPARPQI